MTLRFQATNSRWRSAHALVAVAGLVTAACAGPRVPLAIGSKAIPLDVLLGAKAAVAGAPVPPAAFGLDSSGMPSFFFYDIDSPFAPPSTRGPRPRTTPPVGCFENPLAVPRVVAPPNTQLTAPSEATYTYRATGMVTGQKVPETAAVQVLNSQGDIVTSTASWQVGVTLGNATTTTSYRARNPGVTRDVAVGVVDGVESQVERELGKQGLSMPLPFDFKTTPAAGLLIQEVEPVGPESPDPEPYWPVVDDSDPFSSTPALKGRVNILLNTLPNTPPYPKSTVDEHGVQPPRGVHHGLYVEKIEYPGGATFSPPSPGMLLAKFPLQVGSTFDVAGTDGLTTMSYRTTVKPKAVVHACGTAIDTWTVELTRGRIISVATGQVVEFSARYQVATQYGGVIVNDYTQVKGTVRSSGDLEQFERTLETTTTTEPNGPAVPLLPRLPG